MDVRNIVEDLLEDAGHPSFVFGLGFLVILVVFVYEVLTHPI